MGKGNRRRSLKMRRRKSRAKHKARHAYPKQTKSAAAA